MSCYRWSCPTMSPSTSRTCCFRGPIWCRGFTASPAEGHGSVVQLVEPGELVSGHSPRTQIRTVGTEEDMRAVLALIKGSIPSANVFFWLVPVIEMGRL